MKVTTPCCRSIVISSAMTARKEHISNGRVREKNKSNDKTKFGTETNEKILTLYIKRTSVIFSFPLRPFGSVPSDREEEEAILKSHFLFCPSRFRIGMFLSRLPIVVN